MTGVLGIAIPQGWTASRLKGVTSMIARGSAPRYVDAGPVRAVGQAANQHSGIDWSRTRFHDYAGDPADLKGYLHAGDILVNSTGTGTLGRIGFFAGSPDHLPCMADGHVTVVRADPRVVHSKFAFYWLRSQPFQAYIGAALVSGATNQIELSRAGLANSLIPLPPYEDQQRIVAYLDQIVDRIEKVRKARRAQDALLLQRDEAVMARCVMDLSDDALDHPILGRIDPNWIVISLGRALPAINVGVVVNPSTYFAESGVPFIHGFNVRDGYISTEGMKYLSPDNNEALRRSQVLSGDVLVVRAGATAGRAAMVPPEYNRCNCASVLILRRGEMLLPEYLEAWFNSNVGKGQVGISQYGAAQEVISARQVAAFPVAVPSVEEQSRRVREMKAEKESIARLANAIKRQIDVLDERHIALITAAVTGQFDVSTASGRGIED